MSKLKNHANDVVVSEESKVEDTYFGLYRALQTDPKRGIVKGELSGALNRNGIREGDRRVRHVVEALRNYTDTQEITLDQFREIVQPNITLVERAVKGQLVIPDFENFCSDIRQLFYKVGQNKSGTVADYIPQLARVNPDYYALSICTVDGQVFTLEEADVSYSMQSTCKPVLYCIAMELLGEEKVHTHVGREPSGRSFNEITLNSRGLPHNPLINAGAIMCTALIKPEEPLAERFDYIMSVWTELMGGARPGFNNSIFLSEKETADRNFALAYFMREKGAFPPNTDIEETLDFYFQCCSIEVNAAQHSLVAATLANGGISPITGKRIISQHTVKNCLSLMYSCGMYDFSGEYAFTVGIPAKSGVSGALMMVIPNVMGIVIWSPRLDHLGNSVRGVEFSKELVKKFNFHNYDSMIAGSEDKIDPRGSQQQFKTDLTFSLIWAASQGDLNEIRRLIAHGVDLNQGDYDLRTAMHLAASEGQAEAVRFLIDRNVQVNPRDRWGNTPLADAKRIGHLEVATILEQCGGQE